MTLFDSPWLVALPPLTFIAVNYMAIKYHWIKLFFRNDHSYGVVWYALALLVISVIGIQYDVRGLAIISILVMGYADSVAAIVGIHYGRHRLLTKSVEGSIVFYLTAFIIILIGNFYFNRIVKWEVALLTAGLAMIAELISTQGTDNLTIPIVTMSGLYFMNTLTFKPGFFIINVLTLAILAIALMKKSLTLTGAITAYLIAIILFQFGQLRVYLALITFFIIGSLLSKLGKSKKAIELKIHERQGSRSTTQVLANALPAVIIVVIGYFTNHQSYYAAAVISFAAALADTASSEIGMLSKTAPISIVTFKKIAPGLSGGITCLGLLAGLGGAILISLLNAHLGMRIFFVSVALAFCGTILDSILGALFQAKYRSKNGDYISEQSKAGEEKMPLVSGYHFINNDLVNLASISLIVIISIFIV